jgi:dephospho-CoA kinase
VFIVGLTGDVGAGKSTISKIWHDMGANVINSDETAKRQWERPDVIRLATGRWGPGIIRGGVTDYQWIAERAFSSREDNDFVNSLIHPLVNAEILRLISAMRGWIVAEIPLLFESGGLDCADMVVYVTANGEARDARRSARGWDGGEIARRERFLMSSDEKAGMSDMVLRNDGDLSSWEDLARGVGRLMLAVSAVYEMSVSCGSLENAEKIASALIGEGLAACVNIAEEYSVYRWKGEVRRDREWSLVCKTTEANVRKAAKCIRANHTYELPAITAAEMSHSDFDTLKWIVESCG